MVVVFGIKNCDSVKKARRWLEQHDIEYHFHDMRSDGLKRSQVGDWIHQLGGETLLNRRSTTWRQLNEKPAEPLSDSAAVDLFLQHPTLIKRPVITQDDRVYVGFSARDYPAWFAV